MFQTCNQPTIKTVLLPKMQNPYTEKNRAYALRNDKFQNSYVNEFYWLYYTFKTLIITSGTFCIAGLARPCLFHSNFYAEECANQLSRHHLLFGMGK